MNKAQLIDIQYDPNSFIFSALSQIDESMSYLSSMPMSEPFPTVKDVPAGNYSLILSFEGKDKDLHLRLRDENGAITKEKSIPIEDMFSAMVNSMDMMAASNPLELSGDEDNFGEELLNFFADKDGIMEATNNQITEQAAAFSDFLHSWFEFGESHVAVISSLHMSIVSNASPIITRRRAEMFQGNSQPPKYTKN